MPESKANPSDTAESGVPVFLYWTLGFAALAFAVLLSWDYEHSLGSMIFYALLILGIAAGLAHTIHRKRARTTSSRAPRQ